MSLFSILKFNPYHDPKDGRFTTGDGGGKGVVTTSDVNAAAKALAEGRKVRLTSTKQVSTLLAKLREIVADAKAKGKDAPNYNLCSVSVKGTNLFCAENKGLARVQMPQLSGKPLPGSKGDKLPKDKDGGIDLTGKFREHLEKALGVKVSDEDEKASYLKATQNELNGVKVAGMSGALESGTLPDARLFVSKDNYVVDGHHRWAANVGADASDGKLGDLTMKVARVDMDIITLLYESNKFAKDWGLPQMSAANVKKTTGCGCATCS